MPRKPKTARKAPKPARKAGKPCSDPKPGRKPKTPSGPLSVADKPLGACPLLQVMRGTQVFVHYFHTKPLPTLHAVPGVPGVLVIRGKFTVDDKGFIHDD